MARRTIQDYYPDHVSHCYGCGRLNQYGLHIKSYWEEDAAVCTFDPQPYHISFPGTVYGGLVAALIECHSMAAAVSAAYQAEGRDIGSEPPLGFLVASLCVEFVRRTPTGVPLKLHATVPEHSGRKLLVRTDLSAADETCAHGEVLVIQVSEEKMLGSR